jgi:hypothetical protein
MAENKGPGDHGTGLTRTRWHRHDGGIAPLGNMTSKGQNIRNWLFTKGSEAEREKVC